MIRTAYPKRTRVESNGASTHKQSTAKSDDPTNTPSCIDDQRSPERGKYVHAHAYTLAAAIATTATTLHDRRPLLMHNTPLTPNLTTSKPHGTHVHSPTSSSEPQAGGSRHSGQLNTPLIQRHTHPKHHRTPHRDPHPVGLSDTTTARSPAAPRDPATGTYWTPLHRPSVDHAGTTAPHTPSLTPDSSRPLATVRQLMMTNSTQGPNPKANEPKDTTSREDKLTLGQAAAHLATNLNTKQRTRPDNGGAKGGKEKSKPHDKSKESKTKLKDTEISPADSLTLLENQTGIQPLHTDYTDLKNRRCSLAAWCVMTEKGGGYVVRILITQEDRMTAGEMVGADTKALSAINTMQSKAERAAFARKGVIKYRSSHEGSDHGNTDNLALDLGDGKTEPCSRTMDNITKVIGEGARFGWLADRLGGQGPYGGERVGNTTKGVFKGEVNIKRIGLFSMDPTFEQLWGSWKSAFGKAYMNSEDTGRVIVTNRLLERLEPVSVEPHEERKHDEADYPNGTAEPGTTTLTTTSGQSTRIRSKTVDDVKGVTIISDLGAKLTAIAHTTKTTTTSATSGTTTGPLTDSKPTGRKNLGGTGRRSPSPGKEKGSG